MTKKIFQAFTGETHAYEAAAYQYEMSLAESYTKEFVDGIEYGREGAEITIKALDELELTADHVARIYNDTLSAYFYDHAEGNFEFSDEEGAKAHGFGLLAGIYEALERREVQV